MSALVPVQFGKMLSSKDDVSKCSATLKMGFGGIVRGIYADFPVTIMVNDRVVLEDVWVKSLEGAPPLHWFRVEAGDEVTVLASTEATILKGTSPRVTLLVDATALSLLKMLVIDPDRSGAGKGEVTFEDNVWVARIDVTPDMAQAARYRMKLTGAGSGFQIGDAHGHALRAVDPTVGFGAVRAGSTLTIEVLWPHAVLWANTQAVTLAFYGRSLHG